MIDNIKMYYKNGIKNDNIKGIIYDSEKHNNFITDGYSFIRLNNNNIKDKKRIEDIIKEYGKNKKENVIKSIVNYYNSNVNNGFNIYLFNFKDIKKEDIITEKNKKLIYIKEKDIHINYNMIKRILNISGCKDGSIFISNNNKYMINITCKNSNSYLLGIKTY